MGNKSILSPSHRRYKRAKEGYDEKVKEREGKSKTTGKKPKGKGPVAPVDEPHDKDQVNLTDEESPIMPLSG